MGFELRCKDTMKKLGFANFFAKKNQENAFSLYCAEYQVFIIFKKMTEVNSQITDSQSLHADGAVKSQA